MKLINALIILLFCCSSASALELAEMQKMALENRQLVKQYITSLEKSEQDITLAKASNYPSVDVAYTVNKLDEDGLYEDEENSVVYGQVSYNLFSGFRDKYNIKSAEMLKQIEEYSLQGVKQDLQLSVALSYLAVYERLANKKVAEAALRPSVGCIGMARVGFRLG